MDNLCLDINDRIINKTTGETARIIAAVRMINPETDNVEPLYSIVTDSDRPLNLWHSEAYKNWKKL